MPSLSALTILGPDTLYFPVRQLPRPFINIAARLDGDTAALQAIIRTTVSSIDNTQVIALLQTMEAGIRNALGFQRFTAWLTGIFAVVASFACLLPSLRASRIDPLTALRAE